MQPQRWLVAHRGGVPRLWWGPRESAAASSCAAGLGCLPPCLPLPLPLAGAPLQAL